MNTSSVEAILINKMEKAGKALVGEFFKKVESDCQSFSETGKPTLVSCKLNVETVSGKKLRMEGTLLKNEEESLTLIIRY